MIEKDQSFLMIKIFSPPEVSFYEEHKKLIDEKGYVWFCRFGKGGLKTDSISKDGQIIFIKESVTNGGSRFMLKFSELSLDEPVEGYPEYYKDIHINRSIWFKVTDIIRLDSTFEESFSTNNGGPLENVYRSMCNSFYIKATTNFND